MSATNDGGPAFPVAIMSRQADGMPMTGCEFGVGGMSLRDWFAGMALQGMMSNWHGCANMTDEVIAVNCWNVADAMLAARERKEEA